MKLTQVEKVFESNAEVISQDFTIGDVSVVIEILRNKLYRHKVRTLVQEYISNARDATREVNGKEQIEVTLPTMFAPTFKVRDFGPGISPDRMYNVFIKYASSTKRKDNVQTGGFGIGAKSAWSYTESFSIVTFIDGVQRTYVAHIGANNNGRLDFLGEVATDQANGTEIQIPVSPKDISEFKRSAFRAVYFWKESEQPKFINLNDHDRDIKAYTPGTLHNGNLEVNNNIPDFVSSEYDAGMIIVIDGIPYLAGPSLIGKVGPMTKLNELVTGRLVLHLNNGDLEVSASREEIADSKHTTDSLTIITAKALKTITDMLTREFTKAKTPFEHLTVYMSLKDSYKLDAYRKCGMFVVNDNNAISSSLFDSVKIERAEMPAPTYILVKDDLNKRSRRGWRNKTTMLKPEWFDKLYFTDGTETALIINYRLRSLLAKGSTVIIFTKKADDAGQFDQLKMGLGLKDLKSVNYTKPARKSKDIQKVERTKQEFCIHRMDRYSNAATYITLEKNTQKWLFVERETTISRLELQHLSEYFDAKGYKVCKLGQDAIRRVKGDANFTALADFLKTYKPNPEDINSLKFDAAQNISIMQKMTKLVGIKHKFLVSMIEEYKRLKNVDLPETINDLIGKNKDVEKFKEDDKALSKDLNTVYPLLPHLMWPNDPKTLAEIVIYLNAKY